MKEKWGNSGQNEGKMGNRCDLIFERKIGNDI